MEITRDAAKAAARALRADLARRGVDLGHAATLEIVAHQLGYDDWNTASARLAGSGADVGPPVPVLRVPRVDDDVRAFYLGHLGFTVDWEHRFAADLPLYTRLSRGAASLDLSEHHGDGTPGAVVWLPITSATALLRELRSRPYRGQRPGIDPDGPGGPTIEIIDPAGNTLRFCET